MADGDVKDLRSMIAEAVTASEATPAVVETPQVVEETPEPEAKPARARDEHGRFVAKDGETDEEAQAAGAAEEQAASPEETTEEKAEPEPKAAPVEAPAHWSQADKELVAKLPVEFRADVVNRFKAIEAGFTPKLQKLSQFEKEYGRATEIFAPHMEAIRARGQTASDVIQIWAQVEEGLLMSRTAAMQGRTDPRGAQIAANIIRNYNIDPAEVAKYLMGEQPAGQAPQSNYAVDPALVEKVQTIEQTMGEWQRREAESRLTSAQSQIENFAQAKNPDGSLKHPFYSELEPAITELAQFERSQGRQIDLSALYDRAVWLNESTRERLLSAQRQAAEKRAAEDRKAKAEAARKASSSVTGAPSPGQTTARAPSTRSLRDQLLEAAEEASAAR